MASASDALRRALAIAPASFRPIVVIALSAPLALSACVSGQEGMKTAALKPSVASADAYGYAPVRITAFADGSRIALPSHKPDAEKLAASPAPVAAEAQSASGKTSRVKAGVPEGGIAALAADVAERKAATVSSDLASAEPAPASDAVAIKAARVVSSPKPAQRSALAATVDALDPTTAVPATIAAVAETAGAVKVAAVETSAKAYNAVSERLDDTFGGRDTITGSAAIDKMIERSAAENGIPSELAYAVVRVESHYNPKARGSGVYGLSQIQPATARSLGFSGQASDLYDPETNLRYGMKYLAGAWQKSGHDVCGAAMKYKGGHRTTVMSKSAAAYCANVKRHMAAIERRRAPANRETIIAANEREKQIAVASSASTSALAAPMIAAAASPSGRTVASSAAPVPTRADAALGLSLTAAATPTTNRGGRVIRAATPVAASAGQFGLTD